MNLTEKLKIAMVKQNISQKTLALATNQKQPNLSVKMLTNNFKLSEYEKLVKALGCTLEINIILPTGEKI